jgi:peptidoglycan/LPS O-acetylase OafA/YrhL
MHYEHDVNVMPPETDKARVSCAREPVLQSRQSTAQRAPGYRPDIDGLRALAVIAVVLFHDGVPGLDGGYVGVDVFFVISGYLITQLLEVARGESVRHTLVPFYLRRIRRILPALFATCLATAIAGVVLYVPDALVNLGKYLAAMPVLLSNVAAWTEGGGYFDPPTRQLALSHLWSIAVEEQFYLVYPLLLLTITRYLPAYRRATLIVLGAFSLALCIWASHYKPAANYYAAPTRAWELLLGAALALSGTPRIGHRIANECLALASLVGLVLVVHLYKQWTLYPGTAAILPCMATAVLITTGASLRPALINRVLSWQPLVFVGLISYSLYLWHQPLFVFVNYYRVAPLTPVSTAVLLATTVLVAIASWRFIERPVRARVLLKTPRALLLAAGVSSAGILVAGLVLWNSDGFPQRFSPEARALIVPMSGTPDLVRCMELPLEEVRAGNVCDYGTGDSSIPKVLVWGDSHAMALMPALKELAKTHHLHLYFVGKYGCAPLLAGADPTMVGSLASGKPVTLEPHQAIFSYKCATFNAAVTAAIRRLDPQLIILDAAWGPAEVPPGVRDIAPGIEQTLSRAGDGTRPVCVVFGVPILKFAVSHALLMAQRRNIPDDFLKLNRTEALAQYREMERSLRALVGRGALRVADPKDALCPGDSCLYKVNGHALYFDESHLSAYGAMYVAQTLEPCFEAGRH